MCARFQSLLLLSFCLGMLVSCAPLPVGKRVQQVQTQTVSVKMYNLRSGMTKLRIIMLKEQCPKI